MNIIEIIEKKAKGKSLSREEIEFFVLGYTKKEIPDYQISSLLMAIKLKGMNRRETVDLTRAMLYSGDVNDLSSLPGVTVDKHSTGGVGDKTTLIVLPLVASCGVIAPKMSGRGLGFTGGTIDKLEAIPGFHTNINIDSFINEVNTIGLALASQTGNLVPADKKIYALRDVTGTVESIPLIASSIMSKKLASGADTIVIDLKVGNGALMKDIESARKLGHAMVDIGKAHNRKVVCVLTDMNQPLGNAIGNALEVKEAIDCLNNNGPDDITNLAIVLSSVMVSYGLNISFEKANDMVLENLKNKKAYHKFIELIKYQGGTLEEMKVSDTVISVKSKETGFVTAIETDTLGEIVRKLGGGRYQKEDKIDHSVGLVLSKKIGDYVMEDEEIVKIYVGSKDVAIDEVLNCFKIEMLNKNEYNLIKEMIR